ncbi:MAG: hypothetical protein VB081_09810 [Christensenella sp.]|uniref:antirestriction protein ArdA n=1 Tax=Christensenella sp. TaxID=1935934 RepID=UPI002B1EF428|nr:antirestriction protein ArdA [Christensenella sp.]MEA5003782.1 hypothetical protein [Christensenella sp.]
MADNAFSIRAYIENADDAGIGGFTIRLPTTKAVLRPWLEAIEAGSFDETQIAIRDIQSSVTELEESLRDILADGIAFDELNYLAEKLGAINDDDVEKFLAALKARHFDGNLSKIINLAETLDHYDLQPAGNARQYGDFLLEVARNEHAEAFYKMEQSDNPAERAFAAYVVRLEKHTNFESYGQEMAKTENGWFTEHGYVTDRGEFPELYHGSEDIPLGLRIFSGPPPPMMATDMDMPAFLAQLHAVAGDFSRDAEHNVGILSKLQSAEYLLLMDGSGAFLTECMHAYRQDTDAYNRWMNAADNPETQAFSIHLTEVHGLIQGNIAEVNIAERQRDIQENSIQPVTVEATLVSGEVRSYLPQEWDALARIDSDGVKDWRRVFTDGDFSKVHRHLEYLSAQTEAACRQVSASEFLTASNTGYMQHTQSPQEGMLRISQTAAKEMLARSDCDVYRLLPNGPELLVPTDAIKSGLWYTEHREFAIRRSDMQGLERWAERSAKDAITRQQERSAQTKSYEPEV